MFAGVKAWKQHVRALGLNVEGTLGRGLCGLVEKWWRTLVPRD
jgi:hypothetical protein